MKKTRADVIEGRLVLGLTEKVKLETGKSYVAKIDTGADSSSIDKSLVEHLEKKEILEHKVVRSALGRHKRPALKVEIELHGKKFNELFTVSDRSSLKYKLLIGNNILKKEGFLVDPCKKD